MRLRHSMQQSEHFLLDDLTLGNGASLLYNPTARELMQEMVSRIHSSSLKPWLIDCFLLFARIFHPEESDIWAMTPRLLVESGEREQTDSIDGGELEEVYEEKTDQPQAFEERVTCLNCRRSKVKCDRAWPSCGR